VSDHISNLFLDKFTSFGDLLKFLRRRIGLTQRELSTAVGYSHAQISRLELNQRQPDLATISARFIPALNLEDEPAAAQRLLKLAEELVTGMEPVAGNPPYKGLKYFDENDTMIFFGREALIKRLMKRIAEREATFPPMRFLAIVGASGSGKSSVLRAGLIPALRHTPPYNRWQICSFTPTERPTQALASNLNRNSATVFPIATLVDDMACDKKALHRMAAQLTSVRKEALPRLRHAEGVLLLIDQFEELFTLCQNESERKAFIDNLLAATSELGGKCFVILALRADFYTHCAPYAALRDALAEGQEYIGVMNAQELRRTMEEPAKRGDWELETGLTELLLADIGAEGEHPPEPGAMPLLSHALLEIWQRRQGRRLTVSGYLATGGVRRAIAHTANNTFQNELDEKQQIIAKSIFLRLIQPGDDEFTADTRRRVTFTELMHGPEDEADVQEVLTILANARLITTDSEVAEISHEALIREWPTLQEWLEQDREGLRIHRHLTNAAEGWELHERDAGELYRGARLAGAVAWAESHPRAMSALEEVFLEVSKGQAGKEDAEREAVRQRELANTRTLAETQRKAASDLRKRAYYLSGAFVLALIMTFTALYFSSQARQTAITAQDERRVAMSRELAAASLNNLDIDPELSILLALQSITTTRSVDGSVLPESLEAVHRSLVSSPIRRTLIGHGTRTLSASYSLDGKQLATLGADGTVILWDSLSGEEKLRLPGTGKPGDMVTAQRIAYSPDGTQLAACNNDRVVIYDPLTGEVIQRLGSHSGDATALAFSRDGQHLASGGIDGSVFVWEVSTGNLLLELEAHVDAVEGLAFSPDGRWLITSSDDATMKIWEARTGGLLEDFTDFNGVVSSVTYSPDGNLFAITADEIHVWQIDSTSMDGVEKVMHHEILTIPEGSAAIFSPDGTRLAAASGGSTIKIWDARSGSELLTLVGHTDWVMGLTFSPDGQQLASTSLDGTVKIWDITAGSENVAVKGQSAGFGTRVIFAPDGLEFATNGGDGTATLWNAETGNAMQTLAGHSLEVLCMAFSPDGKRFATGSLDGTSIVWDAVNSEKLHTLVAHQFGVRDIAFSPDGRLIATGGFDGTAKLWEAASGKMLDELTAHEGLVVSVAFNPDGLRLATAGTDGTLILWEVNTGAQLFRILAHDGAIPDITFSPDGKTLATGGKDSTVKVWDVITGKLLITLIGHNAEVQAVSFSPDGKLLATGSGDNTANIWDLQSGKVVLTLPGSSGGVAGVAFSPLNNGSQIAVASNGVTRLFLLNTEQLLTLAEARVTRSLTTQECQKYLHLEQCPMPSQ
jgi:WD40 repeat protein